MKRMYTALSSGKVIQRGTFTNEDLLRRDFPAPEFELQLDVHLAFDKPKVTYQEERRMAYPPLAELADALYWQSQGDDSRLEAYLAQVAEVKAQFPKSN